MFTNLKNWILGLFGVKAIPYVDDILGGFNKLIDKLENAVDHHNSVAADKYTKADILVDEANVHKAEATKAKVAAEKIKSITQ